MTLNRQRDTGLHSFNYWEHGRRCVAPTVATTRARRRGPFADLGLIGGLSACAGKFARQRIAIERTAIPLSCNVANSCDFQYGRGFGKVNDIQYRACVHQSNFHF